MARQLKFTKLSWPLLPPHSSRCGLNQLRYDLRKMRAHGLLERDGHRYAYRPTTQASSGVLSRRGRRA